MVARLSVKRSLSGLELYVARIAYSVALLMA